MDAPDELHWNEHQLEQLVRTIPMFTVPAARSHSVSAIGYDQDAAILAVQLRRRDDTVYAFLNVPPATLEGLLTSASMRQQLSDVIRPRHRCVAVRLAAESVY